MGFHYRKDLNLGPFRADLSKLWRCEARRRKRFAHRINANRLYTPPLARNGVGLPAGMPTPRGGLLMHTPPTATVRGAV